MLSLFLTPKIFGGSRAEPVVEPVFFGNTGTYNNENGRVVKSSFGVCGLVLTVVT